MNGSYLAGNALGRYSLPDEVALTVARGEGPWFWSTDGRRFADYLMGAGPMVLGHAHPRVVSAIAEQAAKGTHYYLVNEPARELAATICRLVPCAESVRFCSDGTEANFYALRLARAFTRRTKILKFDGAFHGQSDYALQSLCADPSQNDQRAVPESAGIPLELSDSVLIAPYNDIERTRQIAQPVADEIAAILVEPVQRAFMSAPGFLEGLRMLADSIGALLVFDEVVTGFRLALGGAQEYFGVTPDLCALGKILGGGLPLAAVAGRAEILELAIAGRADDGRSAFISGTLNGNPLSCVAGLATLAVVEDLQAPAKLREKGETLAAALHEIAERLAVPFQMIGHPAVQRVVFGAGQIDSQETLAACRQDAADRFGIEMIRRGVFCSPFKVYMSVAHTDETHALFFEAAEGAMRTLRDQGLLG
ncbi:hypothetical protein XI06_16610 [Bradyrhizobium sp. CCBAU 11434]|nr:hypothetical protein [Bradyrhizobium sp. CCBAU 11434]